MNLNIRRNELRPDKTELDEEFVLQPGLALEYNELVADARLELDTAEDDLELKEAEIEMEVRSNPSRFGLEKVTENAIKAALIQHAVIQRAKERVRNARHDLGVATAAAKAVDHKKTSLEHLDSLDTRSYFAEPRSQGRHGEDKDFRDQRRVRDQARRSPSE